MNALTNPTKAQSVRGDLPRVSTAILEALQGHESYGQMFADDFNRIRNDKAMSTTHRERLIMSYHRSIQNLMAKKDQYELDANEFAGYSEQELQLVLRDAALQALKSDPNFRREVVGVLANSDPREARRLLGIEVVDADSAEPGYTEALVEDAS